MQIRCLNDDERYHYSPVSSAGCYNHYQITGKFSPPAKNQFVCTFIHIEWREVLISKYWRFVVFLVLTRHMLYPYNILVMNIYWCIHANFCLKPNLTTKLTQNTDEIQTNSLVAETGRHPHVVLPCRTDWLTNPWFSFNVPIWRMMATPSFNVPSYKTSHDWLWDPSQPARQSLYFLFNCWLDISLFASLFYNHQTTARVFAGGLFKYYSREQYLILVYIYAQDNDGSMQK